MITKKYYKLVRVSHADSGYFYIKNVSNEVGEFKINIVTGNTEYSLDGVTWTSYDFTNRPTVNVNPGSNIYLRGTNWLHAIGVLNNIISFSKNYEVGGNLLSLVNYNTMTTATYIDSWHFSAMFKEQTNLISANDLNIGNVTLLYESALNSCFSGCSSLTKVPNFSSITTVNFNSLASCFSGCSSLTEGADFSSVTTIGAANSFNSCYYDCTHISNVTAPNIQDLTQNNVLRYWLNNAGSQATGTKVVNVPTGATIATDSDSGIPTGWTRVNY